MHENQQLYQFNRRRLKAERIMREVPATEIAAALGISKGAYYKKESGLTAITVDDLATIMSVLGITPQGIGYFFEKLESERDESDNLFDHRNW